MGATAISLVVVLCVVTSPCLSAPTMGAVGSTNCMSSWLSQLGLTSANTSTYTSIFHREAITEKALRLLTLQDLESLGVASFVHRILIHNSLHDGSSLCKNSGECNPVVVETDSFECECLNGFSGSMCETMSSCSDHICLNGGNCSQSVNGGVECACPGGYTGERCENDPCHSKPCQNGGSCSLIDGGYTCTCPLGYAGTNCENAWLTESDYTAFKTQTTIKFSFFESVSNHLLNSINAQNAKIEEARTAGKGPRFLSHWATIEGNNIILHTETFKHSNNVYFTILYSNHSLNTYSLSSSSSGHLHLQSLFLPDAVSFTIFDIGGTFYLAVAKNSSSASEVYRWGNNERFTFHSSLSGTKGARDVEFVRTAHQGTYLVLSCHYKTVHIDYPVFVYKWVSGGFHIYQYLEDVTSGLTVDSITTSNGEAVLLLTHRMENGDSRSVAYHWNGTHFDDRTEHSQVISVVSLGKTLLPFTIGAQTFLIGQSPTDSSKAEAFRYNKQLKQFESYASIDASKSGSALAVEYFHTSTEHFLLLSNHVVSQSSSALTSDQYSVLVYVMEGAGFRLFQEIQTTFRPSVLRQFSRGDCKGVAVSGANGHTELYQWSDATNDLCSQ